MGHKRKNPTPSPIKMLSIFNARERGVTLPEIAERTGHSISSIMRWSDKHSDEGIFFKEMLAAFPNLEERIGFDANYPKGGQAPEVSELEEPETDEPDETDDGAETDAASSLHLVRDE